jgi:hypothetical protein
MSDWIVPTTGGLLTEAIRSEFLSTGKVPGSGMVHADVQAMLDYRELTRPSQYPQSQSRTRGEFLLLLLITAMQPPATAAATCPPS